jgi:hypothetical protein
VLVALAVSVAIAALGYRNPFNGTSFAVLALALAVLGGTRRGRLAHAGPTWAALLGVLLILYGSVYPHFVEGPWYRALYAAPVGVLPCPTLAVAAGLTLIIGGFGSRALPAVLAVWTAFYALFGIFRLGVTLDAGLFVAMLGLVALAVHNARGRATRGIGDRGSDQVGLAATTKPILR